MIQPRQSAPTHVSFDLGVVAKLHSFRRACGGYLDPYCALGLDELIQELEQSVASALEAVNDADLIHEVERRGWKVSAPRRDRG
jgi:hypothetical protein